MKPSKIMMFLLILSLAFSAGWSNAQAAPSQITPSWGTAPGAQQGQDTHNYPAESLDVTKLPSNPATRQGGAQKLKPIAPPQDMGMSPELFAQLKAQAANATMPTLAPNKVQIDTINPSTKTNSKPKTKRGTTTTPSLSTPNPLAPVGPIDSFAGPSMNGYYPADSTIAVGQNTMIVCVNSAVIGYTKSGTQLFNIPMSGWWSSNQRSGYTLIFNPVCKYDNLTGRFIIVAVLYNGSPFVSKYLVSVSKGSDITSISQTTVGTTWWNYAFDASKDGTNPTSYFASFPDVGIDNTAIYITSNQNNSSQVFQYSKIRILNKTRLYNNTVNGYTDFWQIVNPEGNMAFSLRAAHNLSPSDVEYFIDSSPAADTQLSMFRITTPTTSPLFQSAVNPTPVTAYSTPPDAQQLGSTTLIQTNDARLMNAVVRNGYLWTAHTIAYGSVAAVRWYELDPAAATEVQEGTYLEGESGASYFYPAVTVDSLGNLGMTFSYSSPNVYPTMRYTGQFISEDGLNTLEPSSGVVDGYGPNTSLRWGDYGGAAMDPNSAKMWFIHQFAGITSNSWMTQIFSGDYPLAQPFSKLSPTYNEPYLEPINGTILSWQPSQGATSYYYCVDTTNDQTCTTSYVSVNGTSATLSGLTLGTTYYWQVWAVVVVNGNEYYTPANGSDTAFWNFTTQNTPGAFSKSAPLNSTVPPLRVDQAISWNAAPHADYYQWCVTTSSSACASSDWSAPTTSLTANPTLAASSTYHWQVRAHNSIGDTYADGGSSSSTTGYWTFVTGPAPLAFAKTSPANAVTNQLLSLNLTWGASTNATSYDYCLVANTNTCNSLFGPWQTNGTNLTKALSSLTPGTTYYWHVRAINTYGTIYSDGSLAATRSFTTASYPGPFDKNTISSPSDGATNQPTNVTLSWGVSTGSPTYSYCINTGNPCSNWVLVPGNGNSVALSLAQGTTYYWQVKADTAIGTAYAGPGTPADWSFTTGTLPDAPVKSAPGSTVGTTGVATNTALTWTPAGTGGTVSQYEYCIYPFTASTPATMCDPTTGTWNNVALNHTSGALSLAASTTYFWQVRSKNIIGYTYADGGIGTFWKFTTAGSAPSAFTKIGIGSSSGTTGASLTPTLSWNASSPNVVAYYEYCLDTVNPCSNWTNVGTNTSVTLSTALNPNTVYYWQVRAVNGVGNTQADGGTFWKFTTLVTAPAAFGKIAPTNGSATGTSTTTISWQASTGATSYQYCTYTLINNCGTSGSGWTTTASTSVSGISVSSFLTTHWQVRAINASGTTYADDSGVNSSGAYWTFTRN